MAWSNDTVTDAQKLLNCETCSFVSNRAGWEEVLPLPSANWPKIIPVDFRKRDSSRRVGADSAGQANRMIFRWIDRITQSGLRAILLKGSYAVFECRLPLEEYFFGAQCIDPITNQLAKEDFCKAWNYVMSIKDNQHGHELLSLIRSKDPNILIVVLPDANYILAMTEEVAMNIGGKN